MQQSWADDKECKDALWKEAEKAGHLGADAASETVHQNVFDKPLAASSELLHFTQC